MSVRELGSFIVTVVSHVTTGELPEPEPEPPPELPPTEYVDTPNIVNLSLS